MYFRLNISFDISFRNIRLCSNGNYGTYAAVSKNLNSNIPESLARGVYALKIHANDCHLNINRNVRPTSYNYFRIPIAAKEIYWLDDMNFHTI